jgi:glutathione S-transferase
MTIKLYDLCGADRSIRFSPYCWRTRMSLAHKGLAFETIPVAFTEIPAVAGGFSPTVPVIDDGGRLVRDSWDIAVYLDEAYPDRPPLFGGASAVGPTELVNQWSIHEIHRRLLPLIAKDIHDGLAPGDQDYFRPSREKRLGRALETAAAETHHLAALHEALTPLRKSLEYRPFLGGEDPRFADYIVFGALQWARVTSPLQVLAADDPVGVWFERCLDLHGGLGRSMPAARGQGA